MISHIGGLVINNMTKFPISKFKILFTGKEIQPWINQLKTSKNFLETKAKKVYFKFELITDTPELVDISKCSIVDEIIITDLKRKI